MEPREQKKPIHEKQILLDQFIRKKVKLDIEESKSESNSQPIQEVAVPVAPTQIISTKKKQCYNLPHNDGNWAVIKGKMQPIGEGKTSLEENFGIIEEILKIKTHMKIVNISILKKYLRELNPIDKKQAVEKVFPTLAKLVLRTPDLFPTDIPILTQGSPQLVTFSKEQCACILANMFMGTTTSPKTDKISKYFNFYFWCKNDAKNETTNVEKLKCLYNYFTKISEGIPDRYIRFERLVLRQSLHGGCKLLDWKNCANPLTDVVILEKGKIEDSKDSIEIDFANQYLGGMALSGALAQEEIIFTIAPECLVGTLICEIMTDQEAILIQGAEIYSNYSGYRQDFKFAGPYHHSIPTNASKILNREIIAVDALNFKTTDIAEFSTQGILRELNKAYIGFNAGDDLGNSQKKSIATGRWGCGVFKANIQLKFIIQWAAASKVGRSMLFHSFEDKKMKDGDKIVKKYNKKSVGDLVADILRVSGLFDKKSKPKKDLFSILLDL